jgi:Peptidase A4 family
MFKKLLGITAFVVLNPFQAIAAGSPHLVTHYLPAQHMVMHSNLTATTSTWAGYVYTGELITSVAGTWIVPTVTFQATPIDGTLEVSANWVGVDGWNSNTLIQVGVAEYAGSTGDTNYYPFFAYYPTYAAIIIPQPVAAGDIMMATIICTANCSPNEMQTWVMYMIDITQLWTWSESFQFNVTMTSAEFILEEPDNGEHPISNYGQYVNSSMIVNGDPTIIPNIPVIMEDSFGLSSNPSALSQPNNAFEVCYGNGGGLTACPEASPSGTLTRR